MVRFVVIHRAEERHPHVVVKRLKVGAEAEAAVTLTMLTKTTLAKPLQLYRAHGAQFSVGSS